MNNKILSYLRNANSNMEKNPVGDFFIQNLRVYIKEPLPENIQVKKCFSFIFDKMPKIFYSGIEKIMIGQFPFLIKREVDALYKDRTIYITNNQETNDSLIADIIHELAHYFEEQHKQQLYGDEIIRNEFLSKRNALYNILSGENLLDKTIQKEDFYNTNYNENFDMYLYKSIGYDKLHILTNNLFISPYAATCLREYFANAFEAFFVQDMFVVKKYAPNIYNKLINYLEI